MGWTWYFPVYKSGGKIDRKTEVECNLNLNDNEVVKAVMVGTTYYGAIRSKKHNDVFAVCVLTKYQGGQFGYKIMDECEGPCYYDCPRSVLDLLTQTSDKIANAWRRKCYEKSVAPKLSDVPIGTRIKCNIQGDEKILLHHEPAYQFKGSFWYDEKGRGYIPKKHIPDNWEIYNGTI